MQKPLTLSWTTSRTTGLVLALTPPCLWLIYRLCILSNAAKMKNKLVLDPNTTDPPHLMEHTEFYSAKIDETGFLYPRIRIYFKPCPETAEAAGVPPLHVFVHGLGGSVAQFGPLLHSLTHIAPCLAIDFPGCGRSEFSPSDWKAYSTNSLVRFLIQIINEFRIADQKIVFVCHSMGCSIGALLTSSASPFFSGLGKDVLGMVAICPPGKLPSPQLLKTLHLLLCIPNPIFNIWRKWDSRGGVNSASITRFAGVNAPMELRRDQLRFNHQSRTPVFRRIAYGSLPRARSTDGYTQGAFVGKDIWSSIHVPVLIIAAQDDAVTAPQEAQTIATYLGHSGIAESLTDQDWTHINHAADDASTLPDTSIHKLIIFPSPAGHGLMYSPDLVQSVGSMISHFSNSLRK